MSEHVSRVRKLYKFILRLHRNLPDELRILGDSYAKEEFKRHKKCKPEEAHTFLNEWRDYALSMSRQATPARVQRQRRTSEEGEAPAEARSNREVGQEEAGQAAEFNLPRFGHDLPEGRVLHMTPEQLYSFYELQCHARGITPPVEPIDEGIGLVDADISANRINHAQKNIVNIDKNDKEKLTRGEIKFEDLTFQASSWVELFDQAVEVKDKAEAEMAKREMMAIDRERVKVETETAKKEAIQAKSDANAAIKDVDSKKIDRAIKDEMEKANEKK